MSGSYTGAVCSRSPWGPVQGNSMVVGLGRQHTCKVIKDSPLTSVEYNKFRKELYKLTLKITQ